MSEDQAANARLSTLKAAIQTYIEAGVFAADNGTEAGGTIVTDMDFELVFNYHTLTLDGRTDKMTEHAHGVMSPATAMGLMAWGTEALRREVWEDE